MRSERFDARLSSPRLVVSEFLADLENDPLWRREIVASTLAEGTVGQTGAVYHETVSWEGLKATIPLRVTAYEPGTRLEITVEEPGYRGVSDYRFADDGAGTLLTLQQSMETSGGLVLVEPFLWGVIARWVGRDITRLDQAITDRVQREQAGE